MIEAAFSKIPATRVSVYLPTGRFEYFPGSQVCAGDGSLAPIIQHLYFSKEFSCHE